jgi:hypothetical protein
MKMINNKKGLSDVVTTVLIILIGLVAVAAIGVMIINQVNNTGKQMDKQGVCTENNVQVVRCLSNSAGTVVNVKKVDGAASIKRLIFTQTDSVGSVSSVTEFNSLPSNGAIMSYTHEDTSVSLSTDLKSVSVNAIYDVAGSSEEVSCPSNTVACTTA